MRIKSLKEHWPYDDSIWPLSFNKKEGWGRCPISQNQGMSLGLTILHWCKKEKKKKLYRKLDVEIEG